MTLEFMHIPGAIEAHYNNHMNLVNALLAVGFCEEAALFYCFNYECNRQPEL